MSTHANAAGGPPPQTYPSPTSLGATNVAAVLSPVLALITAF